MPTTASIAQRDQTAAAVNDARAQLRRAGLACDAAQVASPDPWLATQVRQLLADITNRRVRLCPHVDGAPRVLHAALWAPGLLVCQACTRLLAPTLVEDSTCDRCRRTVASIHAHLAQVGAILLGFGLCPACATATAPDAIRKDTK
jgi:hypothetical protein